jgi:hypothetical protein
MVIVILGAGAISIVDESTGATIAVPAVFVYLLVEVISGYQQFMMNQH